MKSPKHIVITGASSGIGAALAQYYAAPGITLSLTGRNLSRLEEVVEKCAKNGANLHHKIIDVTERKSMNDWLLSINEIKPIDLIVANAGISGGTGTDTKSAKKQSYETLNQIDAIFDVNLNGVINTIQPLLPYFTERQSGQVAIMSSLAGFVGWPGAPAYCASKSAIKSYGESLRGALAPYNIQVNVICPGFVVSRMTDANNFSMPFLMETDKAAKIIVHGLQKNKAQIAFPFSAHAIIWLLSILPKSFVQSFLKRMPSKSAQYY